MLLSQSDGPSLHFGTPLIDVKNVCVCKRPKFCEGRGHVRVLKPADMRCRNAEQHLAAPFSGYLLNIRGSVGCQTVSRHVKRVRDLDSMISMGWSERELGAGLAPSATYTYRNR